MRQETKFADPPKAGREKREIQTIKPSSHPARILLRPPIVVDGMTNGILSGKTAIIHGGAGAIGGAIARTFVREGAKVFLTGRTRARVFAVAAELSAHATQLDALDEAAVEAHARDVTEREGGIDVMVNAIGVNHVQGVGLADLSLEDFMLPVNVYVRSTFLTARAAGRHMAQRRSGAILTLSVPGSRMVGRGYLGGGAAFAAVEAMSRLLAAELGPEGIRVACLCSHAIPEAMQRGSHTREVFAGVARSAHTTVDELFSTRMIASTLVGRLPTLADVAETAAFVASPRAAAITGATINLTCGALVDH